MHLPALRAILPYICAIYCNLALIFYKITVILNYGLTFFADRRQHIITEAYPTAIPSQKGSVKYMSIFYQNRAEQFLFYLSENNTFATHLHKQVEILVVIEGQLHFTVDHNTYQLSQGEGAIVFPNQLHSLETKGQSQILLCIFDADFCHSYRKHFQNRLPSDNVFNRLQISCHNQTAVNGLVQLTQDFQKGTPIPKNILALADGYLTLLLADIFAQVQLETKTIANDLELEQQLLIYLDSHYTEDLSLESLSKEFGVSRFVLSRLFTDKLHTTFPSYVNSKRLELAKDLLFSTDLSITQIALDAGFGSSRTFFREFRQAFHVTPGEYRKRRLSQPLF